MTMNQLAYQNLRESQRANIARESETQRSNIARETETNRSNKVQEFVSIGNLRQRAFEYSDMAAYNKALSVAQTAERATKAAENAAKTVKTIKDTVNPLK